LVLLTLIVGVLNFGLGFAAAVYLGYGRKGVTGDAHWEPKEDPVDPYAMAYGSGEEYSVDAPPFDVDGSAEAVGSSPADASASPVAAESRTPAAEVPEAQAESACSPAASNDYASGPIFDLDSLGSETQAPVASS